MCRIVGYHLPVTALKHNTLIRRKFSNVGAALTHLTFERRLYSRHLHTQGERKQATFDDKDFKREKYLGAILEG